jgi:hypothetical protein
MTVKDNYTIFADKPESSNRYDSFSGDTIFAFELSSDALLEIVVSCLAKNLDLEPGESGYEIIVLYDGHPIPQEERDAIIEVATVRAQQRLDDYKADLKRKAEKNSEEMMRAMYISLKNRFEPSSD